jgi:hypothetical protein
MPTVVGHRLRFDSFTGFENQSSSLLCSPPSKCAAMLKWRYSARHAINKLWAGPLSKRLPHLLLQYEYEEVINGKRIRIQDLWTDITANSHTLTEAHGTGNGVMKPYVVSHSHPTIREATAHMML